jgi:hypothetical protein
LSRLTDGKPSKKLLIIFFRHQSETLNNVRIHYRPPPFLID